MIKMNIVWTLLGAILIGSCQTIPEEQMYPADQAAQAKGSAPARTEEPEEPQSGKVYAMNQSVEYQQIRFHIETSRRANTVPKIKPQQPPKDGVKREWQLFYISISNQSKEAVLPSQHPTFSLVNPQGQQYSEDPNFNKQANQHTDYSAGNAIAGRTKMSKAVGFYVPKDERYALAVQVPSRNPNKAPSTFYFNLQSDE